LLSGVLQQFTRKRRPQRSLADVRPLHADVRLRVRAKRAPLKLRVDVTKLHQHPLRSLTEMRHPGTKPLAEQMARLRGCDRIESSDACASVAPQARIRPASRRAGNPSYNISRSRRQYCKTKKAVLIALYVRLSTYVLIIFLVSSLHLVCIKQRRAWQLSQPQPCPNFEVEQGCGHLDSELERSREPVLTFSSFHTPSKLLYSFQNVSSFRNPRDACNLR
jgi:hypothetical protein